MPTLLPTLLAALAWSPPPPQESEAGPEAQPQAEPEGSPALLLRGATLHSMLPGDTPRVVDVWIQDGHIRAIGPEAPSGSDPRTLVLTGKHLFPGLIDAHVNFDPEHDPLYLAGGITLIRDLGGDHVAIHMERFPERRDRVPGPTLLTAGAPLDGDPPAASSAVVLRNPDAVDAYLPILLEENVSFFACLPGLSEDVWRRVLFVAHESERPVFGMRPPKLSMAQALEAGQDGFHGLDSLLPVGVLWDAATPESLGESIVALTEAQKPLVPLLHASALRLEDQESAESRRTLTGLLAPTYETWWRAELSQRRSYLEPDGRRLGEMVLAKQARALGALFDAGAPLLPGSGAPQPWCFPGTSLHQELLQWVRAGIPVKSVLELATRGAAEILGLGGERGTLEVGAWADVLVLDADPSEDLVHLLDPAWVIVRGQPVSRAEIEERLNELGARQGAARAEQNQLVEVAPPPQEEEGVVLLEGTVQNESFGTRLGTERYRVVRVSGDVLLYTARVVYPPTASSTGRELTLQQFVRNGRVEQVHATLQEGESRLEHDGLWTANTWRMQTRLDGRIVNTPAPFGEQPACIDAGSVTTCLVLGQLSPAERLSVVQLHPGFDAELSNWRVEPDAEGNHRVRTHVGYMAFRLSDVGAVEFALTKLGSGVVETRSLASASFGGPGLPPPPTSMRERSQGETRPEPAAAPAEQKQGESGR